MCEFNCEHCRDDPGLKEVLGCVGPSQGVVWDDRQGETFFNCPLLWVSEDIIEWYQEYLYDIEIGTPLNFHLQSAKYIEAWLIYKNYFSKYQAYQTEKLTKRQKGDDLDAMAANLMAQKRGR